MRPAHETIDRLLQRSLAAGARSAEAFVKVGSTRAVRLGPDGSVGSTRTAEGGASLRVFLPGGSCGFASICGPVPEAAAIDAMVRAAIDSARGPAPPVVLPDGPAGDGRGLGIFDSKLHAATPADLEGMLDEAAAEALRLDPRVRRLDSASIAASSSELWLSNSSGFGGGYRQTLVHISLGLMAGEDGASTVVRRSRTTRSLASLSPRLFGDESARLAVTSLEGRPPGDGRYPALIAPAAAAQILRAFARTLVPPGPPGGAGIGSDLLTILDDGRLPGGTATAPFDGEGVPTRRTRLVERGRFGEMLHDLSSAARHGASSTGNGIRNSFRDAPRRMPSNLFIAPGAETPSELMSKLHDGLWIQTLRPAPSLSRRTGEDGRLAALAAGRRIVGGQPADAIAGLLLTVPIADLMSGIAGVGNDLTFGFPGSFGSPSLLVDAVECRAS